MTKDEALRMALEALEKHAELGLLAGATITAIREALAQPEQEPVAFYVYKPTLSRGNLGLVADGDLPWVYDQDPSSGFSARMLVTPATSPPASKPWVGLTQQDIDIAFDDTQEGGGFDEFARALEAKLREKNA